MNQNQIGIIPNNNYKLFNYSPELNKFVIVSTICNTKISKDQEYKRDIIYTMKKKVCWFI